jgi:hypothetical protein
MCALSIWNLIDTKGRKKAKHGLRQQFRLVGKAKDFRAKNYSNQSNDRNDKLAIFRHDQSSYLKRIVAKLALFEKRSGPGRSAASRWRLGLLPS